MAQRGSRAQWAAHWEEYVRGNVVSKHAARIIQTLLLSTFEQSNQIQNDDAESVGVSDAEAEIKPLKLDRMGAKMRLQEQSSCKVEDGPGLQKHRRANAINIALWAPDAGRGASAVSRPIGERGPMFALQCAQHELDKRD